MPFRHAAKLSFSRSFSRTLVITAVVLLLPHLANAQWSRQAIDFANSQFGYFPGPQSLPKETRGALASVWGGGMREVRFSEDMHDDEFMLRMPSFFKSELKVFLRTQTHKAPLIVVIPGVFANANDAIAKANMKWFSNMGYHVLTLPNCWSVDFAKARPYFKDEYPSGEANVVLQATLWAIEKQIGAQNVTSVQLIGESLGALTAAVVYARDSRSPRPVFNAGATLTWPPIVLHSAMAKLDGMMQVTNQIYQGKCRHLIKQVKTKWRVLRGKYILEPTGDEIECAPAVVAQFSFRKELVKLANEINKSEKLGRQVPENLTFSTFIHDYAPRYRAALDSSDRYGQLDFWMSTANPSSAAKVRILTSEDDFLNYQQSWDQQGLIASASTQLIVAHWGGHIGLTNTKAYEGFIKTQFQLH